MRSLRIDAVNASEPSARGPRPRHGYRLFFLGGVALVGAFLTYRPSNSAGSVAHAAAQSLPGAIDQSILPSDFRTNWDPGIPGGIPTDTDPVRPAKVWPDNDPYGGYSVDPALKGPANAQAFTNALQAAIVAAGAQAKIDGPGHRRIVKLKRGCEPPKPGTRCLPSDSYYVSPQTFPFPGPTGQVGIYVNVDNVTIRGEGPNTTRLAAAGKIGNFGTVVLFGHRRGTSEADFAVQPLTATAVRGAVVISVQNASQYAVGDVITIDRRDGAAEEAPAVPPPPGSSSLGKGPAWLNGGPIWFYDAKYFKRQPSYDWNGPGTGAPAIGRINSINSANTYAKNVVPVWRSRMQTTEIIAIEGNTLTIRDPLHLDFLAGPNDSGGDSQVWRNVPLDTSGPVGNRWSGIEDIAVAGGNNDWGFPGGTVAFSYMAYAWAKNIEADGDKVRGDPSRPGKLGYNIGVGRSYRVVIRDSYAHGSADISPGGHAYGIVVGVGSSACLVENNISVNNNKPVTLNSDGGGNVIAYNYVDRAIIWRRAGVSNGWLENAIDDSHGSFTHHDLIEGNWAPNIGGDTTHGNSAWHTHLRNYAHGNNLLGGAMTSNLRAVGMDGWTHDHAYIGNVLNVDEQVSNRVYETTPFSKNGTPVYQLGNNYAGLGGNWDNGYAWDHIHRDGNWDNVRNCVVWKHGFHDESCVPPVPPRVIPASLYLTTAPAFFEGYTWPWVEPLAGLRYTLPAQARFDAISPNVPVP